MDSDHSAGIRDVAGSTDYTARANLPHADGAKARAETLKVTLQGFEAQGLTQRQMLEELNRLNVPSARGGQYSLMQLQRVLKRLCMTTG
jgi:hypothetical protein